jgi:hypothetical protein
VSVDMNLFFSAPGSLGRVARALNSALGVQLRPVHDDGELARYEYWGLGVVLVCTTAEGFVDDGDKPLSRYRFYLSVEPRRLADVEEEYWNNLMYYASMYCFSRITHKLKWPAILTYNTDELVAQFEPGSSRRLWSAASFRQRRLSTWRARKDSNPPPSDP